MSKQANKAHINVAFFLNIMEISLSVGLRLPADGPENWDSGRRYSFLYLFHNVRCGFGAYTAFSPASTRVFSAGVRQRECDAYHSPSSVAEFKSA
jgi:hypothetical protein